MSLKCSLPHWSYTSYSHEQNDRKVAQDSVSLTAWCPIHFFVPVPFTNWYMVGRLHVYSNSRCGKQWGVWKIRVPVVSLTYFSTVWTVKDLFNKNSSWAPDQLIYKQQSEHATQMYPTMHYALSLHTCMFKFLGPIYSIYMYVPLCQNTRLRVPVSRASRRWDLTFVLNQTQPHGPELPSLSYDLHVTH